MKSKRSIKKYIALFSIFVLLVGVGVFTYKQKNNITAIYYAATSSEEDLEKKQEDNNKLIAGIVEKFQNEGIALLNDDELEKLKNGELSEEDALKVINEHSNEIEESSSDTSDSEDSGISNKSNDNSNTSNAENEKNTSEETAKSSNIGSLISQIYALRSSFSEQVDSLVSRAASDVVSGQYTESELIDKYAGQVAALEGSCDAQFNSLLGQIESALKESGGDLSIISELRSAYDNEKSIKKASILSQYTK